MSSSLHRRSTPPVTSSSSEHFIEKWDIETMLKDMFKPASPCSNSNHWVFPQHHLSRAPLRLPHLLEDLNYFHGPGIAALTLPKPSAADSQACNNRSRVSCQRQLQGSQEHCAN
uniref:Uncharacterized protein n=1 Tax=Opuntia streptacantha TaxID=393608 RepID=A0A7C8ZKD2_OPUST